MFNLEVDADHCYRVGEQGILVHNASLPEGMERTTSESNKDRFRAVDCDDSRYYIDGRLSNGTLTFEVVAVVNRERGQFSGRQFFDALMGHIGRRRVKVISAVWSDAQEGLKSNLDKFNEATKDNASKGDENQEAAAFATYTGRWAADYNFTVAQNIDARPVGTPGGYEQVTVDFVRPPRAKK